MMELDLGCGRQSAAHNPLRYTRLRRFASGRESKGSASAAGPPFSDRWLLGSEAWRLGDLDAWRLGGSVAWRLGGSEG